MTRGGETFPLAMMARFLGLIHPETGWEVRMLLFSRT